MRKYGTLRLIRTTLEPRESLQDGAILVERAATKNWYKCDCGQEISYWYRDIKGKELSLLTDCGCGILARMTGQNYKVDMSVVEAESNKIQSRSGQKTNKIFSVDLDLLVKIAAYAEAEHINNSQAACRLWRIAFKSLEGSVNKEGEK